MSAELIKRLEEQAVEISRLNQSVEAWASYAKALEDRIKEAPLRIYEGMAKASVNCGANCGCWLARQAVEREKRKKDNPIQKQLEELGWFGVKRPEEMGWF